MSILTDTVNDMLAALEADNIDAAGQKLDSNFFFGGWTPETLDKGQFLGLMHQLKMGVPDLAFNVQGLSEIENTNTAQGTMHITGTQTGTLNLSVLRIPPVQPTQRKVSMPAESVVLTVENGLITRMTITPVAGGGIQGFLHQLGASASPQ